MVVSIAGVESGPKNKGVAGEMHVSTALLPMFPAVRDDLAEWFQTTNLTGGARTSLLQLTNKTEQNTTDGAVVRGFAFLKNFLSITYILHFCKKYY